MNKIIWVFDASFPVSLIIRKYLSYMGYGFVQIVPLTINEKLSPNAPRPSLIFMDSDRFSDDTLQKLPEFLKSFREVPFIMLTSSDKLDQANFAIRNGAQDYLVKNEITLSNFSKTILNAVERQGFVQKRYHKGPSLFGTARFSVSWVAGL